MQTEPPGIGGFDILLDNYVPAIKVFLSISLRNCSHTVCWQLCMEMDPALEKAQYELVRPGKMSEHDFWRYYLYLHLPALHLHLRAYRVKVLRVAAQELIV